MLQQGLDAGYAGELYKGFLNACPVTEDEETITHVPSWSESCFKTKRIDATELSVNDQKEVILGMIEHEDTINPPRQGFYISRPEGFFGDIVEVVVYGNSVSHFRCENYARTETRLKISKEAWKGYRKEIKGLMWKDFLTHIGF